MIETIKLYDTLIFKVNDNIRALKAYPNILHQPHNKYLHPFFDKSLYCAIASSDLIVGLKYLDCSNALNNGYEANYFARAVAHSVYEILNHQGNIIDKSIAVILRDKLGGNAFIAIEECSKKLKKVNKDHFNYLKHIRNNLFGHRNESGLLVANEMLKIDYKKIYSIGKEVFDTMLFYIISIIEITNKV